MCFCMFHKALVEGLSFGLSKFCGICVVLDIPEVLRTSVFSHLLIGTRIGGVPCTRLAPWHKNTSPTALTFSFCASADAECTSRTLLPSRDAAEVAGTTESILSGGGGPVSAKGTY